MEPVNNEQVNAQSSNLYRIILYVLIILIVFTGILIGFLTLRSRNTPQNPHLSQESSPLVSPTAVPIVKKVDINPNQNGVNKAIVYYTLLGRIQAINNSGDTYTLTLISQTGEVLLNNFVLNAAHVKVTNLLESNSPEETALTLDDLHNQDLIQINISGDLKSNQYEATTIYKLKQ
jgi:hypothetical protein